MTDAQVLALPTSGSTDERRAFAEIQGRLGPLFARIFPDPAAERTVVVIPARFTRAEESRTTPGTGLGLSLVRAVAEAHGGNATISGSTVTLQLPGVADAEADRPTRPTRAAGAQS